MADLYGKIFQSIYTSSLMADKGRDGVYVLSSMVILSDKDGVLNDDPRMFAGRIGMRYEELAPILDYLQQPDPASNLTAHEGRRIIPLSELDRFPGNRGYWVVNKEQYKLLGQNVDSSSKSRVDKYRRKERIIKIFKELEGCSVTDTLPDCYETILSVFVSVYISIEVINYLIENHVDLEQWALYEQYRKSSLCKPLKTDQGRKAQINKLIGKPVAEQRRIVQNTMDHEWVKLVVPEKKSQPQQSEDAIYDTGRRLNVLPRPGESMEQYRTRVNNALHTEADNTSRKQEEIREQNRQGGAKKLGDLIKQSESHLT